MSTTHQVAWKEWLLTSALFLVAVPSVAFASFLGAFFTPGLFLYDFAFAVVPSVCPADAAYYECSGASAWADTWSYPVWVVLAVMFGRVTLGRSRRSKALLGIAAIVLAVLTMRAVAELLGFRVFIDTV